MQLLHCSGLDDDFNFQEYLFRPFVVKWFRWYVHFRKCYKRNVKKIHWTDKKSSISLAKQKKYKKVPIFGLG